MRHNVRPLQFFWFVASLLLALISGLLLPFLGGFRLLAVVAPTFAVAVGACAYLVSRSGSNPLSITAFDLGLAIAFFSLGFVRWEPSAFDLLAPALLVVGLATKAITFSMQDKVHRLFIVVCVSLVTVQVVGISTSPFPGLSARYAAITVMLISSAALMYVIAQNENLLWTAIISTIVGAFVSTTAALAAFYGLLPGIPIRFVSLGGLRLKGFFKDPNVLSPYIIMCMIFSVVIITHLRATKRPGKAPLLLSITIVVFVFAVIIAYSRAAWLNISCTTLAYLGLQALRSPGRALRYASYALILSSVVLVAYAIPDTNSLITKRGIGLEPEDQQRFASQQRSWEAFKASPFELRGPGASARLLGGLGPHNIFLQVAYETGIWGVVLLFLLWGGAIWISALASIRAPAALYSNISAAVASALCGLVINSLFIDSTHWRHLWLLIGIGWGASSWIPPGTWERS